MPNKNGAELRPESDAQDVILVLGDWLVDEYWVFGVHRSSTASRTGDAHLRALHEVQGNVQAFCGAGRSAYFLHQLYRRSDGGSPQTAIVGLGFWHRNDTQALSALFDPSANPNNLFRMMTSSASPPAGVDLINMNEAWNVGKGDAHRDKYEYTTRIIRVYHAEPKQGGWGYDRLDWEPRLRPLVWNAERLAHLQEQLKTQLRGRRVAAVVVKDMSKGAVNPEIIDWLIQQVERETPWYVSTKQWNPAWLDKLAAVTLKLYMIPPVAACEAIRREELSCWLMPSGKPSNEAIHLIEGIASESHAETIFILPEGLSALMYSRHGRSTCVVQTMPSPRITVEMGGASIVFPALVACIEHGITESLKTLTSLALETTREWLGFEEQRILKPHGWKPDHIRPETVFDALRNSVQSERPSDIGDSTFGDIREMNWEPLKEEWHQALKSETGVVTTSSGGREFQLWRAMLEVNGYICCDEKKRKQLRKMLQGIRNFAEAAKHHAGCMLVAGPGTGKSFLAKRLADAAHLDFIAFNITQMQTRGDIIKCFEIISEQAAGDNHRRLLVFMDEINALLDREKPYSTFLTPLEDGTYVHNGQTAKIPPCVWVFAGTEHPDQRPDKAEHGTKVSDFVSRLSLGVFDFGRASAPKMAALERVYVGISLLKVEFPEIDRISEAVIRAFHHLPNTVKGARHQEFRSPLPRHSVRHRYGSERSRIRLARWQRVRTPLEDTVLFGCRGHSNRCGQVTRGGNRLLRRPIMRVGAEEATSEDAACCGSWRSRIWSCCCRDASCGADFQSAPRAGARVRKPAPHEGATGPANAAR